MIDLNPNDTIAYYNRGMKWLFVGEWEKAKSDLTAVRDMGVDIIDLFYDDYQSIPDFEQRNEVRLPVDIAEMLTPQE